MSYQVLARKWRPKNFQELIGQEHVLKPLINALTQQRLHHAYLFTGTRGVGKTTIGRILARCLNCERGITAEPCGQCSACEDITQGRFVDLIEVDAASRTKVEDTRELLDNVQYAPTRGRFKIYLIDEVHMLSNHSFNALLKTLEEPPPHIKFLLATTDPQRLPVTILSRCLQFHLKNLAPEIISQHLQTIIAKEQLLAEPAALSILAKAANGSVRDALSLLDQAIAYCQGKLSLQNIQMMLGTVDQQFLSNLLAGLAQRDGQLILTTIQQMVELNTDFNNALEALLNIFHQLAIYQTIPDASLVQDENLLSYVKQFAPEDIQLFYQIGLIGRRDLSLAPSIRVGFEMILLRMLAFYPSSIPQPALVKSPSFAINSAADNSTAQRQPQNTAPIADKTQENPRSSTQPHVVVKTVAQTAEPIKSQPPLQAPDWAELIPKLKLVGVASALATHCVVTKWQSGFIELTLAPKHKPLLNDKLHERLTQALQNHYQSPIKLEIKLADSGQLSPAQQLQHNQEERQQQARISLEQDEHVKTIISHFNAKLVSTDPI
ncbi:MAG: dnaX [Gammaproteobacteria bacterium]|jgi:DNA polymerase-3 subunit gamma/tau|nr:dnaX [Gammaproteobacteria bacterium]